MIDFEKWVIIDKLKKCSKCWGFYGCKKGLFQQGNYVINDIENMDI